MRLVRFTGRAFKVNKWWSGWAIEVPALDVVSQGHSKTDAYDMIADAIESLVNKEGFSVDFSPSRQGRGYFEVSAKDQMTLMTFFLLRWWRKSR